MLLLCRRGCLKTLGDAVLINNIIHIGLADHIIGAVCHPYALVADLGRRNFFEHNGGFEPVLIHDGILRLNPEQTQQQTYTTNGLVWTENYKGVWHLREDETNYSSSTISYKDATTNHYNGTYSYAGTVQPPRSKAGKIAEGQEFRGPGYYIGDGIACGTALNFSSNDFTISVWVNPNAIRTSYFMSKDYSWNSGYDWYFVQSGTNVAFYGQSNLFSSTKGGFAAGQWTQVSFVRENNNGYLYANGEKIGGPYDVSTMVLSNSRTLRIGRRDSLYAAAFGGSLDEIQISGTARSPAWLRAAWLNQTSNSVFQTYSTVHMQGPIFMGW